MQVLRKPALLSDQHRLIVVALVVQRIAARPSRVVRVFAAWARAFAWTVGLDLFFGQLTHIPPKLEEVEQVVDVHHAVSGEVPGTRVGVVATPGVIGCGVVI